MKMSEETKSEFYHLYNALGMVCAPYLYEKMNQQAATAHLPVRYGPPARQGKVQTEEVNLHAATGIYVPRELFPVDGTPTLRLEDALAELYRVRKIPHVPSSETVKTSAERTCG